MKLIFLGGACEVGKSAILLQSDKKLLLDYGIKIREKTEYPPLVRSVDALVLSHAHLDHSGFAPAIYDNNIVPCLLTHPTQELATLLIKDSIKVQKLRRERPGFPPPLFKIFKRNLIPIPYNTTYPFTQNFSIVFRDAGHVAGSALIEMNVEGKKVVYTGDFKIEETILHKGAEPIENVEVLIIESTYSYRDHPGREAFSKKMCEEVVEVVERGGNALLPAFAVGRTQELIQLFYSFNKNLLIYLDGMGKSASEIILKYPNYIKNPLEFESAVNAVNMVNDEWERRKVLSQPSVIITTAGMLEGGPVLRYIGKLNKNSKVFLTGYQVEGTNGRELLENKRIKINGELVKISIPVEYYDLSAHAGRSDLMSFIKRANPEKVFCVHGDYCSEFAEELREMGYEAYAPKIGESFEV